MPRSTAGLVRGGPGHQLRSVRAVAESAVRWLKFSAPFVHRTCFSFANPCLQMALLGLGLIPLPYPLDAHGNLLPTTLLRRASLTGNLIGCIVRASRTAFPTPTKDEDAEVLAHYGRGQYELHQLIVTVIGFEQPHITNILPHAHCAAGARATSKNSHSTLDHTGAVA
jgi:hypothetical protein